MLSAETLDQECETIRDSLKVSIKFSILIDRQVDRSNGKNAQKFLFHKKGAKKFEIRLESPGRPKNNGSNDAWRYANITRFGVLGQFPLAQARRLMCTTNDFGATDSINQSASLDSSFEALRGSGSLQPPNTPQNRISNTCTTGKDQYETLWEISS